MLKLRLGVDNKRRTNELYGEEERSSDHISFPPFVIVIGCGREPSLADNAEPLKYLV